MRGLATYIMKGRGEAVSVVVGAAGLSLALPLVSVVSGAALALVSLRKGPREGAWIFGVAFALTATLGALTAVGPYLAVVIGLLLWLPISLLSFVLRVSGRLAETMEFAFCLGGIAVLAIYGWTSEPAGMWLDRFRRLLQPLFDSAPPDVDIAAITSHLDTLSHYMTGLMVGGSVLTLLLGLLLGRWWQDLLFNPGGFRAEFVALRFHKGSAYLSIALLMLALVTDGKVAEIAWNVGILAFFLFMIAGFAVLHALFGGKEKKGFTLPGIYFLSLVIPQALLPIAVLGLSDVWLDWRRNRGAAD